MMSIFCSAVADHVLQAHEVTELMGNRRLFERRHAHVLLRGRLLGIDQHRRRTLFRLSVALLPFGALAALALVGPEVDLMVRCIVGDEHAHLRFELLQVTMADRLQRVHTRPRLLDNRHGVRTEIGNALLLALRGAHVGELQPHEQHHTVVSGVDLAVEAAAELVAVVVEAPRQRALGVGCAHQCGLLGRCLLLHHMRQLMGQQTLPCTGGRCVMSSPKHDVAA